MRTTLETCRQAVDEVFGGGQIAAVNFARGFDRCDGVSRLDQREDVILLLCRGHVLESGCRRFDRQGGRVIA